MNSKYKIGDTVKVIKNKDNGKYKLNWIGIIVGIHKSSSGNHLCSIYFEPKYWDIYNKIPKYSNDFRGHVGFKGNISLADEDFIPNDTRGHYNFYANEIELVNEKHKQLELF